ncbi:hypothetical protein [Streptomyces sp. NPDC007088]|uniref:hypothetical protein n=1 Tax=Streptomyces sp. NPDC007088 TaxID=3364773 RepID=UPI00369A037C
MIEKTFPGERVSGRFFAERVRERGGSLSHSYFSNILAGKVTHPSEEILKALGLGFGVDWRFFKEESEVVDDVVAGLHFLARRRAWDVTGIAARGASDGLSPELLEFAIGLLTEARDKDPGTAAERDATGTPGGHATGAARGHADGTPEGTPAIPDRADG